MDKSTILESNGENIMDFLAEKLEGLVDRDEILLSISDRFCGNKEYVKDYRFPIRNRKILECWDDFYKEKVGRGEMSASKAHKLIAGEVGRVAPTHKDVVKRIIATR